MPFRQIPFQPGAYYWNCPVFSWSWCRSAINGSWQMIDLKFTKRKPFKVRIHLSDMTRVKGKKWSNFIGCRVTLDFARLNETFTALFCTNNFCCGTEFTERKIY